MQTEKGDDQPISFMCLKSMNNPFLIFQSGEGNMLKKKGKKKKDTANGREINFF